MGYYLDKEKFGLELRLNLKLRFFLGNYASKQKPLNCSIRTDNLHCSAHNHYRLHRLHHSRGGGQMMVMVVTVKGGGIEI